MVIFDELRSVLDIIDNLASKHKKTNNQKAFDICLSTIYTLGDKGGQSIAIDIIAKSTKLSKMDVLNAIEYAESLEYLMSIVYQSEPTAVMLKMKGRMYVEALLEEK